MELGHFLGDVLRSSAVLGAGLSAMPLLRRASSATRHSLLALALAGSLALPLLSALLPAWRVGPQLVAPALVGFELAEPVNGGEAPRVSAPDRGLRPRLAVLAEAPRALDPMAIVLGLWGLGAFVVLARLGVGLARSRAMVRASAPAPRWEMASRRAEETMGRRVEVRVTDELAAPAVTGVLAPVILVPPSSDSWSEERRLLTLLHELAHVKRADCLVQIVGQVACAMHWYNPLAWLAARRLKIERELAADDAVILAGARPSTYAENLLAIAAASEHAGVVPAGALGMAEPSPIIARVAAIVAADRPRRPPSPARAALLAGGCAAVVVAAACATPQGKSTKEESASTEAAATLAPEAKGSSFDPRIQAIADEELDRAMSEWQAAAGVVVVLDPRTGEILANAGRAQGRHADIGVGTARITGSTLKAVTLSAALEEGVLSPTEKIDCSGPWTYAGKEMHDASPHGILSVPEMLAVSTNIGFAKVFDRLGGEKFDKWLHAFHFGQAPAVDGAAAGELPADLRGRSFAGAVAAIGTVMTASPLQVAAAYGAIANGGLYVAPTTSKRHGVAPGERIMGQQTARTVTTMLEGVVSGAEATGNKARVEGTSVAGKTGTAGWALPDGKEAAYASFVGFFPSSAPRFVVLVGLEQLREDGTGGSAAAPAFARVAARLLDAR